MTLLNPVVAEDDLELSDQPVPLEKGVSRPRLLLELGEPFLHSGPLAPGFKLPTGAVWQPSFWVYGTYRNTIQYFSDGGDETAEWTNRLDLFGNLKLSGTERILIGIRPLDDDGAFTEYRLLGNQGYDDEFNLEIETLFFEGDFGEIFPSLDAKDRLPLDLGFSIGRQPISFQEGMLISDSLDAVGITQNTLLPSGTSNLRLTGLYAWSSVHRGDGLRDSSANLFGLFSSTDLPGTTLDVDVVWVHDQNEEETDAFFAGMGMVQRIGSVNTSFRILTSVPLEQETAAVGRGTLLFSEVSWTPHGTHDNLYWTAFWALDEFSSAARAPSAGGALGRAGILFGSPGIGRFGSPLSNASRRVAGSAIGYQLFFSGTRKQFVFEVGARQDTRGLARGQLGFGVRYQQAIGQHTVLQINGFVRGQEERNDVGSGIRIEFQFKF